jgi:hypothetical protein
VLLRLPVAIELAQRLSRGGYEATERDDRLLFFFDQRTIDCFRCNLIRA